MLAVDIASPHSVHIPVVSPVLVQVAGVISYLTSPVCVVALGTDSPGVLLSVSPQSAHFLSLKPSWAQVGSLVITHS